MWIDALVFLTSEGTILVLSFNLYSRRSILESGRLLFFHNFHFIFIIILEFSTEHNRCCCYILEQNCENVEIVSPFRAILQHAQYQVISYPICNLGLSLLEDSERICHKIALEKSRMTFAFCIIAYHGVGAIYWGWSMTWAIKIQCINIQYISTSLYQATSREIWTKF